MGTLIVYYSRNGGTRKAAEALAEEIGAELAEIRETRKRRGFFGFMRSGFESATKRIVPILPLEPACDLASYDRVILATPVWAGGLASPMRSFLAAHAAEIRDHGVLVTHSAPDDSYAPVMDAVDAVVGRKRSFERSVVSDLHVG